MNKKWYETDEGKQQLLDIINEKYAFMKDGTMIPREHWNNNMKWENDPFKEMKWQLFDSLIQLSNENEEDKSSIIPNMSIRTLSDHIDKFFGDLLNGYIFMIDLKYSITVYNDYAIINGSMTSDVLMMLIRLCKKEGFTHMTAGENGKGFKLVRHNDRAKNNN